MKTVTVTREGWTKNGIEQLCYKALNPNQDTTVCGHWCPMLKIVGDTIKVCCGGNIIVEYVFTKDERETS